MQETYRWSCMGPTAGRERDLPHIPLHLPLGCKHTSTTYNRNINTSNMNSIHWQEIDKLQGVQLVDVRTRLEYLMGHIPGSINIPVSELEQHIGQLDLGHPIVVYCAVGMRGANASQILEQLGAIDVRNLVGGYKLWSSTRQG